jgi:hypothetical protein
VKAGKEQARDAEDCVQGANADREAAEDAAEEWEANMLDTAGNLNPNWRMPGASSLKAAGGEAAKRPTESPHRFHRSQGWEHAKRRLGSSLALLEKQQEKSAKSGKGLRFLQLQQRRGGSSDGQGTGPAGARVATEGSVEDEASKAVDPAKPTGRAAWGASSSKRRLLSDLSRKPKQHGSETPQGDGANPFNNASGKQFGAGGARFPGAPPGEEFNVDPPNPFG